MSKQKTNKTNCLNWIRMKFYATESDKNKTHLGWSLHFLYIYIFLDIIFLKVNCIHTNYDIGEIGLYLVAKPLQTPPSENLTLSGNKWQQPEKGASTKHQFVAVFTCLSCLSPIRDGSSSQHDLHRRQGGILEQSPSPSRLQQRRMLSFSSPGNSMFLGKEVFFSVSELMRTYNIC